jgi:hypothetical protein
VAEDDYLKLSRRERFELLDAGSRAAGIAPAILEKDYWVCRTLNLLFALRDLGQHLVFKGGTSLSKVFRLIERFSEDIDVSFHRDFLGFEGNRDPEAAFGNEQRRRLNALSNACTKCIRENLLPALSAMLREDLSSDKDWSLEIDPHDPQTILFHFPQAGAPRISYITPSVRIELGARSDHWPQARYEIQSFLGESLDLPLGVATVQTLSAERTFWEKATLLHAECHRDPADATPARYARHYHDLDRLAESDVADAALVDVDLRKRVVAHKTVYFRSAWARYDLAEPVTFRLVPRKERFLELERDHESMREMFFSPPPSMSDVLKTLSELEKKIHNLPA